MDKTIFRVYPNGEVIALFPQIPAGIGGWLCESYMHIGQHGAAGTQTVVTQTRLASRKEYLPLLKELEQIGYKPVVAKKCLYRDLQIREEQAKNWG